MEPVAVLAIAVTLLVDAVALVWLDRRVSRLERRPEPEPQTEPERVQPSQPRHTPTLYVDGVRQGGPE